MASIGQLGQQQDLAAIAATASGDDLTNLLIGQFGHWFSLVQVPLGRNGRAIIQYDYSVVNNIHD